jgi:hypothetical protein
MVEAGELARVRRAELLERLAGVFARAEPAAQAGKYIDGLSDDLARKNGWTLAERAGDLTPDKMQRLLYDAVWDHQQAMARVRGFTIEHLGDPDAVLVIDESGQEKSGTATAGVKRQYVGCAGKIANAVNVVYASYASRLGHAIVAARLYLPKEWAADAERRSAAKVPEQVGFKTKPELAVQMLAELSAEGSLRSLARRGGRGGRSGRGHRPPGRGGHPDRPRRHGLVAGWPPSPPRVRRPAPTRGSRAVGDRSRYHLAVGRCRVAGSRAVGGRPPRPGDPGANPGRAVPRAARTGRRGSRDPAAQRRPRHRRPTTGRLP